MAERVAWSIKGTWVEACNCDHGCPCNYNGFPTKGNCQGAVAFRVASGSHGGTTLDGLTVAAAASWPGAIHEGNGKMAVTIDERATEEQRQALVRILTGQDGGMPFEILAATIAEIDGPHFAPVKFEDNGTKTRISAPGIEIELAPYTNPVTGEENEVHTVIPQGFIWRDGHLCQSARNVVKTGGIEWDWTGQNAYWADVEWSNAEEPAQVAGTRF